MVSSQSALRGQGPLFLSHASMHTCAHMLTRTHAYTYTHAHTHKHISMRVGLAEISLMTLGRENDASSSSHPEPLLSTLSQATLQVPVTIRPASAEHVALHSPLGAGGLDGSHRCETKGFQVFFRRRACRM